MSEKAEQNPPRRRALQALLWGALLLAASHTLIPLLVFQIINRQLVQSNLKLDASIRISLPNQITLSNVKIQSTAQENAATANRIDIALRPSSLLKRDPEPHITRIAVHGLRGSWNLHSVSPIPPTVHPTKLPLPHRVPDAFEISIIDLTLILSPTPGALVRQVVIKDLSLDASTTREGNFHIGHLQVGASDVLKNTNGETTFFNKQLAIKELQLSEKNFLEHLKLDLGAISMQPSIDFLLLRGNGYISAKASLANNKDAQSVFLRTDAENVTLPLDPFATTNQHAPPQIEINESHTAFEGQLNLPSSWLGKASFSGALVDATDTPNESTLATEINLAQRELKLEKLSVEDPALQLNASASATLNDDNSPVSDALSRLLSTWSVNYSASETSSPLRRLADHFGNPFPKTLPSTHLSAKISQSETNALSVKANFEIHVSPENPTKIPATGSLTWNAPSLRAASSGTLEIDTKGFETTVQNVPISIPASSLHVISNSPNRQLTLKLHLAKGSIPVLTQQSSDAPCKLAFENIPLRELLPHVPIGNPCTLSADASLHFVGEPQPRFAGVIRITDPTNSAILEANANSAEGDPKKLTVSLLHQTARVAIAEFETVAHPTTSETRINSSGDITNAHAFRNLLAFVNLSPQTTSRITWKTNATLTPEAPLPIGQLTLDANGINLGNIGPIDLKSIIQSTGSSIEAQHTTASIGETSATGSVYWSDTLNARNLRILQRNRPVLNGELSIHFPIRKSPRPSPDAPLRASLEVDQLDLATLLGNASPLTGKIHGNLNISGTIDHPVIQGKISSSKLALSGVLAPLNPLSIEIQAHPTPGMVALSAKVSSSLNAPIELTYNGTIRPLLFQDPLATNTTPDTLNLNLKGGSLQLLNQLNDTFKSVAGSVDISLSAKRANQTWQWSGKSSIKAQKLLFESPRAPGLTDLTLNATIKDSNTTAIELVTSSGGGTIRVHGDVQAPLSKNPTLNLSIQTRNVLAYRNESLLLRADSDLTFKGPWNDAVISGEAVPVQSKYFHDIEILPINLTKKGETRDRLKGLSPGFSFKQAPCSDWKFNIHFKSRPRDPMLIRGNRWQGEADVDMLWGGTGLRPWFEGYYHSKNLTAFLPSVRLTVSDGYLWYKRDSPFQGTLDVNALTTARGYRIAAYISGPLAQPDLLLTSKPALDQTDLLSLLTTGVLPSDTNDSPQVIAARATEAIAEDLSRSLLGVDRRMIEGIGRVDVEFSRVNPRTGQQETRVTRRLSEDWSVSGDIGTNGDFTGRLKFLHRFK